MTRGLEKLPEHMRTSVERYVEHGIQPGSFLEAVLENNLVHAFRNADDINILVMDDWAMWLRKYAPLGCWGSPEHVEKWIREGGLQGMREAEIDLEGRD